ncbi:hypothetical protein B7463_g2564, partial [Scytalidium lignicola]
MEESNPELESFRQQWRAEVSARSKETKSTASASSKPAQKPQSSAHLSIPRHKLSKAPVVAQREEDDHDYHVHTQSFDGAEGSGGSGGVAGTSSQEEHEKTGSREPRSALEHYEKAVEKEALGSLGDSLALYRKAFRMDQRVDLLYKNKHFPHTTASSTKHAAKVSTTGLPAASKAPAAKSEEKLTTTQLIQSFASLKIEPTPPLVEGTPPPPSPLSTLPHEILVHILEETAVLDIASFARLAQVCKRLAYLVLTEEQIWKRVCLSFEMGFGAMRYRYGVEIDGTPIVDIADDDDGNDNNNNGESKIVVSPHGNTSILSTIQLSPAPYPSYYSMLHYRPRIRFPGIYISTVNYIRPGQASVSQLTWSNPVHIVTYYRYLRFFRDGTCLSLLTTDQPADVVYHMTMENYELHRNAAGHRAERERDRDRDRVGVEGKRPNAHLPSAVMANAFRGRWKLSGGVDASLQPSTSTTPIPPPSSSSSITNAAKTTTTTATTTTTTDNENDNEPEPEGDVIIETEGIGKYIYIMHLSLLSSPLPPHTVNKEGKRNNNKLTWKGFWSYNRLTDDFGEFTLRNDKAFFWSRVGAFAGA